MGWRCWSVPGCWARLAGQQGAAGWLAEAPPPQPPAHLHGVVHHKGGLLQCAFHQGLEDLVQHMPHAGGRPAAQRPGRAGRVRPPQQGSVRARSSSSGGQGHLSKVQGHFSKVQGHLNKGQGQKQQQRGSGDGAAGAPTKKLGAGRRAGGHTHQPPHAGPLHPHPHPTPSTRT